MGERDEGGTGGGEGGKGGMQTLAAATEEQAAASRPEGAPDGGEEGAPALEDPNAAPSAEDAEMAEAAAEEVDAAKAGADAAADAVPQAAKDQSKRRAAKAREKGAAVDATDPSADPSAEATPGAAQRERQPAAGGSGAGPSAEALAQPEVAGDAAVISLQLERTQLDEGAAQLTDEERAALRERAEACLEQLRARGPADNSDGGSAEAAALWAQFETLTGPLSAELCEQLRLILEPTLAARLQGDYKTGRRLNMRKIIPYLASDFRRDKIWLRRSKPSVRRYQVGEGPPSAWGQGPGFFMHCTHTHAHCAHQAAPLSPPAGGPLRGATQGVGERGFTWERLAGERRNDCGEEDPIANLSQAEEQQVHPLRSPEHHALSRQASKHAHANRALHARGGLGGRTLMIIHCKSQFCFRNILLILSVSECLTRPPMRCPAPPPPTRTLADPLLPCLTPLSPRQVVVAIDDSRSMAENCCGVMALEALTLISRALSRLEVGDLSVVGFGAQGHVRTLLPLGAPFADSAGPGLVGAFTFAQENTITDTPVVELLDTLEAQLEAARQGLRGGGETLQQLVLVVADGHFHEKESLRLRLRQLSERRGLLVVFIALDNSAQSLLQMQSVSFSSGKPVFTKYLDTFPFPYYALVQDITSLPRTLADLLRQWFETVASSAE